jgi:site-specific recombinase XerD
MTEDEFEFYNKEFKAFSKNKKFDVTEINIEISKLININVFEEKIETKTEVEVEISYLNYYKTIMNKIDKPSTKKSYENSFNTLNQYLIIKNKSDLLFTELTKEFITTYITFLRNKSLTDSTIKTYLSSMKAVMNDAIDDEKLKVNFPKNPFRKLELRVYVKPKRLVTREDISKLRHITKDDELFIYSRMFLFSLYTQGMRVSDLVLLKVCNFTKDHCEYMMLKNKKIMKIDIDRNINKMLIDVLQLPDYYTQYKSIKIIPIYSNQS